MEENENENESLQTNKIHRIFSFEDLYKPINNLQGLQPSDKSDKIEDLNLIENNDNFTNKQNDKQHLYMYEKKLTSNSKRKLTIRLSLLFLIIIFISFQIIASNSLTSVEKKQLFKNIENLVSYEKLSDNSPTNIFYIFTILLNKDFISGISCVLYIIFHPFIALKLIYSVCIIFYIIIISKCFYQSRRPFWEEDIGNNDENDIIKCETSFSNPSISIFIIHFYFLYSIFCIKEFYKKNKNMITILKIILFLIFIALVVFEYIFLLLYKLNYLHEMVFTTVLTLVLICLLMDFNKKFERKFFNSTKTIFKVRKNKIKSFVFCFGLTFMSILLYNFISLKKSLLSVEQKLAFNNVCSQNQKEELGLKSTFNDIPYIFCMMGAFWGACLANENNPGIWWYQPLIIDENELSKIDIVNYKIIGDKTNILEILLLIFKSLFIAIVFLLIWYGFYKIPYITFEFNFLINCVKYFCINFICTGIMPIIFGFFKINKKLEKINIKHNNEDNLIYLYNDFKKNKKKKNKNLFSTTLFVDYYEKARYPILQIKINMKDNINESLSNISNEE